jgi:hypothetical protein
MRSADYTDFADRNLRESREVLNSQVDRLVTVVFLTAYLCNLRNLWIQFGGLLPEVVKNGFVAKTLLIA